MKMQDFDISYRAAYSGPDIEPFEVVGGTHAFIVETSLSTEPIASSTELVIRFQTLEVSSIEEARVVCDEQSQVIAENVSFDLQAIIGEPFHAGASGEYDELQPDGSTRHIISLGAVVRGSSTASATALVVPDQAHLRGLLHDVTNPTRAGKVFHKEFRDAVMQKDVTAKFLALYQIMLHLTSLQPGGVVSKESQKLVDDFIRQEEPSVVLTARPDQPGIKETVYTKLRNQIGHKRPGVTIEQTQMDLQQHILGLTDLVKRLIEQQL